MKLAFVLVGWLATPALAAPQQLCMQWHDATNMHLADQSGASNRSQTGRITVNLAADGKLTATDVGSFVIEDLYPSWSTTRTTAWSNTWQGRWTLANGALALELVLGERTCTKEQARTDEPTEILTCAPIDRTVTFACTPLPLVVSNARGRRTRMAAWACATSGALSEGPTRWTLGEKACVCTVDSPDGRSFETCARDPGP